MNTCTNPFPDIESRAEIEALVNSFYQKIRAAELLGPIFDDVAKVDWNLHFPGYIVSRCLHGPVEQAVGWRNVPIFFSACSNVVRNAGVYSRL